MGTQHRVITSGDLLDDNGHLVEPGYATQLVWRYDRSKIHAKWHQIKEWDYYYILDATQQFGISFTMSDLGYLGLMAVAWLDFRKNTVTQYDTMTFFPKGKIGLLPDSGDGKVHFADKKLSLTYEYSLPDRKIMIDVPKFTLPTGETGLHGELILHQDPSMETMVIATSWQENRKAFYYNQKINCMPARGTVTIGDKTFSFSPETSFGGLDWGRGRWTYKNRWYWASASGMLNGASIGWNLGYGFSDRMPATENMIFYKGKAHKLEEITFHIDTSDYMQPWRFSSSDGRFEMEFEPAIDRYGKTDFKVLKSEQHQVFGYFTGDLILDDGNKLHVDRLLGFAEDVFNKW